MPPIQFLKRRPDPWIALGLAIVSGVVLLPWLGSFPLWDPWETQYTQVAWEMQERGAWNDLYYQNSERWWSKPIFAFWMLRASLALFWDSKDAFFHPELAARLPFALSAIAGVLLHFDWVRRLYGRWVGALAALILLTAPQYVFIGRQVMIDMPFLMATSSSLGYLTVALLVSDQSPPPSPRPTSGLAGSLARAADFLRQRRLLLVFWILQAIAVLLKGFVAPVLAALLFSCFALATYERSPNPPEGPPRDSRDLRPELTLVLLGLIGLSVFWISQRQQLKIEQRTLLGCASALVGAVVLAFGVWRGTRPIRHLRSLLSKVGAPWGLLLFLALAAPWFVHMTLRNGWSYWESFLLYHHLGRATGEIAKPGGTFDYFARHFAFGFFPWSALLIAALARAMGRATLSGSVQERSNALLLAWVGLGFTLFSLTATKLAHYIFPIVPPSSVLIAATLIGWTGRKRGAAQLPAEGEVQAPAEGDPQAPAKSGDVQAPAKGEADAAQLKAAQPERLLAPIGLSLLALLVLSHDVLRNPQVVLNSFNYYYNRTAPESYDPSWRVALLLLPAVVVLGLWFIPRVRRSLLWVWTLSSLALACVWSWHTMPAMGAVFSYKPLVEDYYARAKAGERLAQYNSWPLPGRSVLFFSRNRVVHLNTPGLTRSFLNRPGRKFIIVDESRLSSLQRLANERGEQLHVVSDRHPYARLLSNLARKQDVHALRDRILPRLPEGVEGKRVTFADGIELLGWKVEPRVASRGQRVRVKFYFSTAKPTDIDWEVFVHGDGLGRSTPRIIADHHPLQGLYPTSQWKPGEVLEDEFTVRVPDQYPNSFFILWTGLHAGGRRLGITQAPHPVRQDRARGPLIRLRRSSR